MDLAKEVEGGKTHYEAGFRVANRSRGMMFNSAGKTVSIEDELVIDTVPAGACDAFAKFVAKWRRRSMPAVLRSKSELTAEEDRFRSPPQNPFAVFLR